MIYLLSGTIYQGLNMPTGTIYQGLDRSTSRYTNWNNVLINISLYQLEEYGNVSVDQRLNIPTATIDPCYRHSLVID